MITNPLLKILIYPLLLIACSSYAVTTVNIKIVVMTQPCVINDNKPIDVDFGDAIVTSKINGDNYRQKIQFDLKCPGDTSQALQLKMVGSDAGFSGDNILKTSKEHLGIALISDGVPLPLNSWTQISYNQLPILDAMPILDSISVPDEGYFTAQATMMVEYK